LLVNFLGFSLICVPDCLALKVILL